MKICFSWRLKFIFSINWKISKIWLTCIEKKPSLNSCLLGLHFRKRDSFEFDRIWRKILWINLFSVFWNGMYMLYDDIRHCMLITFKATSVYLYFHWIEKDFLKLFFAKSQAWIRWRLNLDSIFLPSLIFSFRWVEYLQFVGEHHLFSNYWGPGSASPGTPLS